MLPLVAMNVHLSHISWQLNRCVIKSIVTVSMLRVTYSSNGFQVIVWCKLQLHQNGLLDEHRLMGKKRVLRRLLLSFRVKTVPLAASSSTL